MKPKFSFFLIILVRFCLMYIPKRTKVHCDAKQRRDIGDWGYSEVFGYLVAVRGPVTGVPGVRVRARAPRPARMKPMGR